MPPQQEVAQSVVDLAAWVVANQDNRGLPFAIIDKSAAQLLVFGEDGKVKGMAPVLLGSAVGDHSAPGVGDRELSDIPLEDRTTPAGRFFATYGPAPGRKRVLWVDYASAVSIHPLIDTVRAEQRPERLASATPDDNRVTHGCINVAGEFYEQIVRPTFQRSGIFYVLPDSTPLSEALPGYQPPAREPPPRRKRWWRRAIERAPTPEVAKAIEAQPNN